MLLTTRTHFIRYLLLVCFIFFGTTTVFSEDVDNSLEDVFSIFNPTLDENNSIIYKHFIEGWAPYQNGTINDFKKVYEKYRLRPSQGRDLYHIKKSIYGIERNFWIVLTNDVDNNKKLDSFSYIEACAIKVQNEIRYFWTEVIISNERITNRMIEKYDGFSIYIPEIDRTAVIPTRFIN